MGILRLNGYDENTNEILLDVQTIDERRISKGSTTPPALVKRFLTRMLTRDLFAVANLVKYKNNYIVKTDVTFRST